MRVATLLTYNGRMATKLTTYSVRDAAKGLPTRIQILKWGDNKNVNQPLKMGPKTMTFAPRLAKARGHDRIALDFQHNTVPGSPAFKESTEPRKVAAYGTVELIEGDGAYLNIETYTPAGQENAAEYLDVSPAVELDENGEVIFFHSVALCRQGAVEGLELPTFEVEFEAEIEKPEGEDPPEGDLASQIKTLTDALAAMTAKVAELQAKLEAMKPAEAPADVATFTARLDAIEKIAGAAARERAVDRLKADAANAGKIWIFSAQEETELPLETMKGLVERLPKSVSVARQTTTRTATFVAAPAAAEDPALAGKIRAKADEIQKANPRKPYATCWAEAEKAVTPAT